MKAVGIVAEYNPLHNGHLRHLQAAGEGGRPLVVAMSGDFTQRGEPAVFSKFARAEAAVRCGASLVLELPLPWCLSSAEGFARGAVGLLAATGVVDSVCFGSESGDLGALDECAEALLRPETREKLRTELKTGVSFPRARERAVSELWGERAAEALRRPNDLLGVEYCKAIRELGVSLACRTVRREGSQHDGENSAASLRARLERGAGLEGSVPEEALAVYRRETEQGRGPVLKQCLRLPVLSRLRALNPEDLADLPDAAEGLENRLYRALREETDPEAAACRAKSKRYALSRLRRWLYAAALGLREGMAQGIPPYIRVLAMDKTGRELLRAMRDTAALPVVLRPARLQGERGRQVFSLGARAHDLYVLGYGSPEAQRGGQDWKAMPYIGQL